LTPKFQGLLSFKDSENKNDNISLNNDPLS